MNDSLRIVHFAPGLDEFDHGYQLRRLLSSQVAARHQVMLLLASADRAARRAVIAEGADCHDLPCRWSFDPFAAHQFSRHLQSTQPSIVHLWGNALAEYAALARWAAPRARILATISNSMRRHAFWPYDNRASLDAAIVDHASPSASLTTIAPGVECPPASNQSRREFMADLDLPEDALLIAAAGPLVRKQRLDDALWNYELVRTIQDRACLLIVGQGPDQWRLERYARLVTEPATVRFLEPSEWLAPVLQFCHVYWQPGHSSLVPTAMLQAMACRVPVIANLVLAHQVVIDSGRNGLLIPTEKRALWTRHTEELLREDELRNTYASAGRATIDQRFALATMLAAYERIYLQRQGTRVA